MLPQPLLWPLQLVLAHCHVCTAESLEGNENKFFPLFETVWWIMYVNVCSTSTKYDTCCIVLQKYGIYNQHRSAEKQHACRKKIERESVDIHNIFYCEIPTVSRFCMFLQIFAHFYGMDSNDGFAEWQV